MAVTQYIGARYVPLFAEPILWDANREYEPLTIVTHEGNSYTSRQAVPVGISITNESFWALTGNYNAQVEQYRREVRAFDGRITANSEAITDLGEDLGSFETETRAAIAAETQARTDADTQISANVTANTQAIAAEAQARADADTQISANVAENAQAIEEITANGWVNTQRIENGAVTIEKISQDVTDTIYETVDEKIEDAISALDTLETVSSNWYENDYKTSYWGVRISKEAFEFALANSDGTQNYNLSRTVVDFMTKHKEAIIGCNCDFGTQALDRPIRINGVNYNSTASPHYYPLLACDTRTQTMRLYPSRTSITSVDSAYNYAFSVSHQLITDYVAGTSFQDYTGSQNWNTAHAPRIAMGEDDNNFYLMFCEGRGLCERGMTLPEFARLFKDTFNPRNAYNFDGGGSVMMCVNTPQTVKVNATKDFNLKFDEFRKNTLCMHFVVKAGV